MELLTTNTKILKSMQVYPQFNAKIMQLIPGKHTCSDYTKACLKDCLAWKGYAKIYPETVIKGRKKRTDLFLNDLPSFMIKLEKELNALCKASRKKNKIPVVRLNGFSDIDFSLSKYHIRGDSIFNIYQEIYFYDYTKNLERVIVNFARSQTFKNYHLTFSHEPNNLKDCATAHLAYNTNISVIDKPENVYPFRKAGLDTINGDGHDFRFLDPDNSMILLKHK